MTEQARHNHTESTGKNWAGNISFGASRLEVPENEAEIQRLIGEVNRVKALGSRHSFSRVADTDGVLVAPRLAATSIQLDVQKGEVVVPAGMRYGELAESLWKQGWALPNLASLPHISVVGACATATHGSGVRLGNLATSVRAFEIVTGTGELRRCSVEQDGERFHGMVVNLGALGVVTSVTLEVVPSFDVAQTVFERLPVETLVRNFDRIASSGYSVSFFTDWGSDTINQVWVKERVSEGRGEVLGESFFGAQRASGERHPVDGVSAESCTPQLGAPGPWHRRLPHFKLEHTPSVGDELQTEYFVSRVDAPQAIERLSALGPQIRELVLISELRSIASDSLWLSPNYQRDCVGIHFTWRNDLQKVLAFLPTIESALEGLNPTPHWAKLSTLAPEEVRARFPRLCEFQELLREFDPKGKFHNDFVRRYVL
jgi:xylitol oxidase